MKTIFCLSKGCDPLHIIGIMYKESNRQKLRKISILIFEKFDCSNSSLGIGARYQPIGCYWTLAIEIIH